MRKSSGLPSDVTSFYQHYPQRLWVEKLSHRPLPAKVPHPRPAMPLSTATDGGCDVASPQGSPWTRQIATLTIEPGDAIISSVDGVAQQELYDVVATKGLTSLLYAGVHENMCIMNRPFAIEETASWRGVLSNIAVVRELVDVMYTPKDSPYVSHAEGVELQTRYVERFWASSVSMYDFLEAAQQQPKQRAPARRNSSTLSREQAGD